MGTYIAYSKVDPQPSWMKAERYEYCERYFKSENNSLEGIRKFFGRLLNKNAN